MFALIEALIGFQPDTPHGRLALDPALPAWLPDLEIRNLRLGGRSLDLRFCRDGEATRFEVTKGDPAGVERRPMCVPAEG